MVGMAVSRAKTSPENRAMCPVRCTLCSMGTGGSQVFREDSRDETKHDGNVEEHLHE